MFRRLAIIAGVSAVGLFSSAAYAQGTTATVSTSTTPSGTVTTTATAGEHADDAMSDHDRVVGRFGVTFFNVSDLPIGNTAGGGITRGSVSAPVIGVRYWLMRNLGIDAGIGIGWSASSTETKVGGNSTSTDAPSPLGLALHGGVPLAFAYGKHYSFLAIPEFTVGFTTGTVKGQNGAPDADLSGFRLDVGARVGAEVYFGFIGVPELALTASVGLAYRYEGYKVSVGDNSVSANTHAFGTTVQSDPWAIFTNNISATYYF